ncbi:MAG: hypothetical protein ACRD2X_04770 [Vicinamibacteraceae bacterium]
MSTKAARDRIALPQGTLDLLILRSLRLGPQHGHAIAKAIEQGRKQLTIETRKWDRLAGAIARILRPATQE